MKRKKLPADRPANREALLKMERKDAQTNQRLILLTIATTEYRAPEIARLTGIAEQTVRRHIRLMHRDGRLHIKRWARPHIRFEKLWIAGSGEDAPEPEPISRSEKIKRAKLRREIDPEIATRRASENRRKYLRHRAPPPDPAAAWLTGTTK